MMAFLFSGEKISKAAYYLQLNSRKSSYFRWQGMIWRRKS
jgi:hypothetical protein